MKAHKFIALLLLLLFAGTPFLVAEEKKKEDKEPARVGAPLNEAHKKWMTEEVFYIISDYEKNAFLSLKGDEDRDLGKQFCISALKMLRSGGNLYLVANRHMPYEAVLKDLARNVDVLADENGFKILHAQAR